MQTTCRSSEAMNDYPKRASHKSRLLSLLSDGQVHHMRECIAVGGNRYGGRIFELRKQGFDIESIQVGKDEWAYRLVVPNKQLSLV